jgi:hypothetical protein
MEPSEIRAEVERRKKRAQDLKIREALWYLHSYFRFYDTRKREDPRWVYPGIDPGGQFSDTKAAFCIGETQFELIYKETRVSHDSHGRRSLPEAEIADGTVALTVNGKSVFDFDTRKTTTYYECGPAFDEHMGEVTRFIDGPWVTEIVDFLAAIETHQEEVRKKRSARREARELDAMKKRFGL